WIGIKAFSIFLKLKAGIVLTSVVFFSIIGSYVMRNSFFDIYVMLVFGLIGYAFEKLEIPLAPMILGLILGRMIEDNLRVGLIKTKGNFLPFLTRPISLVLFLLIVFTLIGPWIFSLFKKHNSK
ncbi:MAG: tripartite tricarboxylate transporter permease, partial [Pseudothermotoga sp.]